MDFFKGVRFDHLVEFPTFPSQLPKGIGKDQRSVFVQDTLDGVHDYGQAISHCLVPIRRCLVRHRVSYGK